MSATDQGAINACINAVNFYSSNKNIDPTLMVNQ